MDVGETWNESRTRRDGLTGRTVRALTTRGRINQTPTYHTNSGFSADSRHLVFASVREGATWVLRADVAGGELKALWRAPGVGDRNYLHRGMGLTFDDVDGRGICGNRVCMAPRSRRAVFTCGTALHAVHIDTCEHTVLLDDVGDEWIFGAPCLTPREDAVAVALSSAHPELLAGRTPTRRYTDFPHHRLRIVRAGLDGRGDVRVLFERDGAQSAHCAFCPADADLLYFDLDLPPRYWGGGDGKTPRIRLLDVHSGRARPLKRTYPGPFQVHQAWLWDGSGMCYHGGLPAAAGGGGYFGIADVHGRTRWERSYPQATFYGHITPAADRPALITDGCFSPDRLQWLYRDRDGTDAHLEPICVHGTDWRCLPGQYAHPHPLTDPAGKYVSFTAARDGRSDVYVVEV